MQSFLSALQSLAHDTVPKHLSSRLAIYSETLDPRSPASELVSRTRDYPLRNLALAFEYPNWTYGYGIGNHRLECNTWLALCTLLLCALGWKMGTVNSCSNSASWAWSSGSLWRLNIYFSLGESLKSKRVTLVSACIRDFLVLVPARFSHKLLRIHSLSRFCNEHVLLVLWAYYAV